MNEERGAHKAEPILDRSAISTVNLSETLQKSLSKGADVKGLKADLEALGISPVPFGADDAEAAAELWIHTKDFGLSIGDRACLATALRLDLPVITADSAWSNIVDPRLNVALIR